MRARRAVLRRLQVGIDAVVHRVQFFGDRPVALRDRARRDVRVDRFLPVADARERVRRHVQRVRRRRRDLRVAPRGVERPIGERRHVVAVDDVVREARMIRLAGDELLENRAGLQQVRVTSCRSATRPPRSTTRRRSTPRCRSGWPPRPSPSRRGRRARACVDRSSRSRRTAATPRRYTRARASSSARSSSRASPRRAPAAAVRLDGCRRRTDCPTG